MSEREMDLRASVQFAKGVGPKRAEALQRLGILTVEDLLLHLPLRYEDRRRVTSIASLAPGSRAVVSGSVIVAGARRVRRLALYEARIEDGTGRMKAVWFNQPYLRDVLVRGAKVVLFGDVERDALGSRVLEMRAPQWEVVKDGGAQSAQPDAALEAGQIVPVYEKLGPLAGKSLRRVIARLVESLPGDLPDPVPPAVRRRHGLVSRAEALVRVHHPAEEDAADLLSGARGAPHYRLVFEELFLFELGLGLARARRRAQPKANRIIVTQETREAVKRILPFRLTNAQKRVLREIVDDMQSPFPMHRLVQGDVGSGKTLIALLSMIVAVLSGYQAAFMAPTEILAEQHFLTFQRLLAGTSLNVELLTSARSEKERQGALARLGDGAAGIAVGTHALIQRGVAFARLALAVVDEQHRFGVLQREELRRKGPDCDLLVMTATPIPRTLALTAWGDLDVSVVDEKPPGRSPIRTIHRTAAERRSVVELAKREVALGRQVYVVYPLVLESEKLEDVRAATAAALEWRAFLPDVRVGLLHGRLPSAEKEAVMSAFSSGKTSVLVATTVVEVGVDVPNATMMIVEHAERFGLAQLHQLRGRVGRGGVASTCVLLTHGRLSDVARERIGVLVRTEDGFVIAEKDLEIRGPGDFFGTRQWGMPTLRVAHLIRDADLLEVARNEAIEAGACLAAGEGHPELVDFVADGAWERRFGLSRVG